MIASRNARARLLAKNLEVLCLLALAELSCRREIRNWKGRTLLGDEKTVALLEGDAVSVRND